MIQNYDSRSKLTYKSYYKASEKPLMIQGFYVNLHDTNLT